MSDKQFTLYWLDGKRQVISGETIERAFTAAGYGAGALKAVDFYFDGDNHDYQWNKETRSWDRKEPFSFKAVVASLKEGRYKLMVSHNLGASYFLEYATDDKEDPELKHRMTIAKEKMLRYYVEGDNEIVCDQHKNIINFLGGINPVPFVSRDPDLNRGENIELKIVKLNQPQRSIEEQAALLRNKFGK